MKYVLVDNEDDFDPYAGVKRPRLPGRDQEVNEMTTKPHIRGFFVCGMMGKFPEDQSRASALLKQQRELFRPIVDSYMGKWIKEIGDGLLLTFDTVTDAPPIEYESNVAFNTLPNHLQSQDDLRTCHSEYLDD